LPEEKSSLGEKKGRFNGAVERMEGRICAAVMGSLLGRVLIAAQVTQPAG
jgi:hypothetical protein